LLFLLVMGVVRNCEASVTGRVVVLGNKYRR
jgi:hypothetical protein